MRLCCGGGGERDCVLREGVNSFPVITFLIKKGIFDSYCVEIFNKSRSDITELSFRVWHLLAQKMSVK